MGLRISPGKWLQKARLLPGWEKEQQIVITPQWKKCSIQEIKLLSSFELCETKRAICRMILASFESYKRQTPSCTVLISFSGASVAQLNSLGGNGWKGQNWLLSGWWLNSTFKHLRNLWEEQRGASVVPAEHLGSEPGSRHQTPAANAAAPRVLMAALAAFVFRKLMRLC